MRRLALLVCVMLTAAMVTAANPYTTPPGGSATGVPSASQSGLVPNTSSSGNGGTVFLRDSSGRSFRGVVPYGSSFYYDRSGGGSVQRFSSSPTPSMVGGTTSYYDPRTGIRMDYSRASTGGNNPMVNPYAPANLPQLANTQFGPLPRPITSRPEDLARELDRRINPDLLTKTPEIKKDKDINALAEENRKKRDMQVDPDLLLPKTERPEVDTKAQEQPTPNRYEQIRDQVLEDVKKKELDDARKKAELEAKQAQEESKSEDAAGSAYRSLFDSESEETVKQRIASQNEQKVKEYFAAAQEYLKEGRYYKAADTYGLALYCQPENAMAYAGQCWALFGAGEYMSSAYYLNRAITLDSTLAAAKMNFASMLPDRDIFENRMLEMARWQELSRSGEMAFLMAYLFWQDDKIQSAQQAINRALELMPEDAAVQLLAKVINAPAGPVNINQSNN